MPHGDLAVLKADGKDVALEAIIEARTRAGGLDSEYRGAQWIWREGDGGDGLLEGHGANRLDTPQG